MVIVIVLTLNWMPIQIIILVGGIALCVASASPSSAIRVLRVLNCWVADWRSGARPAISSRYGHIDAPPLAMMCCKAVVTL